MTKFQALMSIATMLISHAKPGYANPDKNGLNSILTAVAAVTTDDWEADTLTRIAWWESGYRKEYINCTIIGKAGDRGAFQVIPRSHSEAIDACSTDFEIQAKLALSRIRESRKMCEVKGFRGSDVLGGYTVGHCVRNEPLARLRYGDGTLVRSLLNQP
jgi:hypothetical protein